MAAILLGVLTQWVHAQQEFKLSDQDRWQQSKVIDPASPEGQLLEARKTLAAGDGDLAEEMATKWIEKHEQHPLLAEAFLVRADALVAQGEEYDALFDYEYIARTYPGSEIFVTSLQRELDIAKQYAAGRKRKLWGLRIAGADSEAEELFIRVQERLPGSRLAEEAGMQLADFYFERRNMSMAVEAFSLFIENYPRSDQVDKARKRLIYAHLASFKGPEFDARGLYEARARLKEFRTMRPAEAERVGADALLTRIDESDAAKMLETAKWYVRIGNPIASELTIRRLVKKYPKSVATADALRLIPEVLPQLPKRVQEKAPDYEALRSGILGTNLKENVR